MTARYGTSFLVVVAQSILASTVGLAQQTPETPIAESGLEEITVTAQRRTQNLQDVPISITAFDSRQLKESGFTDSLSIGDHVPNMEIKVFGGVPNIFIRGVGNSDFNSSSISPISIYRDDVVTSSVASQIFSLFDLDRVEVLRGPQGTLFGKNTTGGSIQYFSKLPADHFEGEAMIGFGNYGLVESEAAVSLPIVDTLSARVSGTIRRTDGGSVNLFTGDHTDRVDQAAERMILRWRPEEQTDVRLTVGGGRDRSDYRQPKPLGTIDGANLFGYSDPAPDDPYVLNFQGKSRNYTNDVFVNLNASQSFGDFTVKSITGYDDSNSDIAIDADGSPLSIDELEVFSYGKQITQELQLAYDNHAGLDGIVGLYYYDEHFRAHSNENLLGLLTFAEGALPLVSDATRRNKSYAVFTQGTYSIIPALRITVGGRYTIDQVHDTHQGLLIPGVFDPSGPTAPAIPLIPYARLQKSFNAPSWRFAVDYDLAPDVLAYASVNRGFKAGGFSIGVITSVAQRTTLLPEFLTAYEAGVKSTLLDRKLRLNLSAFYYAYKDLQVQSVSAQAGNLIPTVALENAANADIKGLEAEVTAVPTNWLDLGFSLGLLNAKYEDYVSAGLDPVTGNPLNFSGNRLPGAPTVTALPNAQVTVPLSHSYEGRFRAEYAYTGKKYYNNAQSNIVSSGTGYGLLNLRATLANTEHGWELAAWAKNATNKSYIVDVTDLSGLGFYARYFGDPATYGAELNIKF